MSERGLKSHMMSSQICKAIDYEFSSSGTGKDTEPAPKIGASGSPNFAVPLVNSKGAPPIKVGASKLLDSKQKSSVNNSESEESEDDAWFDMDMDGDVNEDMDGDVNEPPKPVYNNRKYFEEFKQYCADAKKNLSKYFFVVAISRRKMLERLFTSVFSIFYNILRADVY